jgi:hypothetical protein
MNKLIFLFSILIFPSLSYSNTYNSSDALKYVDAKFGEFERGVSFPEQPQDVDWVTAKLKSMVQKDQYIRIEWNNVASKFKLSEEEKVTYDRGMGLRMTSIDALNTAHLKSILDHHEWIKISQFGEESDQQRLSHFSVGFAGTAFPRSLLLSDFQFLLQV